MNDQHIKGKTKEIKGKVKEEVGHVFGSEKTESEGIVEQVAGQVQNAFGNLKDKVKEKADQLIHTLKDKRSA